MQIRHQVRSRALRLALCALCLLAAGSLGPREAAAGVNRWSSTGPTGGLVWHIAGDPADPAVLYAATEGGPFKSTDGGQTWRRLTGIFKVNGMDFGQKSYWTSVSPDLPGVVYAGTDRTLFRSDDGGATWKYKSQGLPPSADVPCVAIDPVHPATVYAAVYWAGIYKSADRGDTWSPAGTGLPAGGPEVFALAVDPQAPSTVYAALAADGVYKTLDGGRTWTRQSAGLAGRLYALAMDPGTPATLYAGTDAGLFKTVDGGNAWNPVGAGLPANAPPYAIAVAPDAPAVLWAAVEDRGVWRSDDGGATWGPKNEGLVNELTAEAFWVHAQRGGVVLAATRAGTFKSADGGDHWALRNDGLTAAAVYEVEIAADGAWYAATYGNGIGKSTDRGATWTPVNNGLSRSGASLWFSALAADRTAPATVYAAGQSGFFKTTDGGASWAPLALQETGQSLLVDPADHLVVYAGTNTGVFKSPDGGASWQPMKNGLARRVWSLATRPGTPSVVFAGTDAGVYRSTDGGGLWEFKGVPGENVWGLAADPRRPLAIYAVSDYAPYESTDGGETWNSVAQLEEPMSLWAALVDPSNSRFFAAGGDGVWELHRPSRSWWLANRGSLTARYVQSLKLDARGAKTLVAGIYGGGVASWTGRGLQSPNGRETVPSGGVFLTEWVPTPRAHHYGLDYSLDGGLTWRRLARGIVRTDLLWRVPVVAGNRGRCLVRVTAYSSLGVRLAVDRSDAPFAIEVVRMEAPWAEETARPGQYYEVFWRVNRTVRPVAKTLLSFSADGGRTWSQVAELPGGSRVHYFKVPNVDTDAGRFRVVLLDADGKRLGSDDSALSLKIKPRAAPAGLVVEEPHPAEDHGHPVLVRGRDHLGVPR